MSYWRHWHNWRYEASKWLDEICLAVACRLPGRIRMWVVVNATNIARELYPDPTGYIGPEGLGYEHIYDGALRKIPEGVAHPRQNLAHRVHELEEALRLTQEYIGDERLPPLPGWSWYDALYPEDAHKAEHCDGPLTVPGGFCPVCFRSVSPKVKS